MDREQRYLLALGKFFAANPKLAAKADDVREADADAVGVSLDELRQSRRSDMFREAALLQGIAPYELVLRLAAKSPEQANAWRLESKREEIEAIGMDWDEYKQLNGIKE